MSSIQSSTLSSSKNFIDLSTNELIKFAVGRKEGVIAANGALSVTTGKRTGRSPKDKFIVREPNTEKDIDWGPINQALSEERFHALWQRAESYTKEIDLFISNLQVGADSNSYLPVKVITEYAWHNLFARQLFIRPENFHGKGDKPEWTILSLPGLKTDPQREGVNSDATLVIHLTERKVKLFIARARCVAYALFCKCWEAGRRGFVFWFIRNRKNNVVCRSGTLLNRR